MPVLFTQSDRPTQRQPAVIRGGIASQLPLLARVASLMGSSVLVQQRTGSVHLSRGSWSKSCDKQAPLPPQEVYIYLGIIKKTHE